MRAVIGKDRDLCTTTCPKCKSSDIEVEDENMHPYSATIICKSCNETTLIHGRMLDPSGLTYFYHDTKQCQN